MKGILGRKIGMTEIFTKDGKIIPVTVVSVEPNVITQVKTSSTDGYDAIQLSFTDKKEKRATKAEIGHAKKANTAPKRFLKEIRVSDASNYELGSTITADVFEAGEKVDVQGTSKGKGFTGVIKRHNQSRGPETHGSRYHRRPGSMGSMRPMRVPKGKKLSGHMGHETTTVQNLTVVEVDIEMGYILVSGNVPGPKNSIVLIREAVKGGKKEEFELASYNEEEVVNEVETADEVVNEEVATEEVQEETVEETTTEVAEEAQTEEIVEETPAEEAKEENTPEVEEQAPEEAPAPEEAQEETPAEETTEEVEEVK